MKGVGKRGHRCTLGSGRTVVFNVIFVVAL